jgi:bifunctional ADP-heptose synthase (sugar kinase/adenylyltransferase)
VPVGDGVIDSVGVGDWLRVSATVALAVGKQITGRIHGAHVAAKVVNGELTREQLTVENLAMLVGCEY